MRLTTVALTCVLALSSTAALANAPRHHHHWRHAMNSMRHHGTACSNPSGTAGGPTTLSGTGPSTYGGNSPGPRSCTGQ
jgi:hypothetical protein